MNFESVLYQVKNGVATITLNRPEALNAFNKTLRLDLKAALELAVTQEEVRVVVLTGAGRGFCAGASLPVDYQTDYETIEEQILAEYKTLIVTISEMPKLVIAAVNGVAAGIGSALAMACDLVLIDEDAYIYQAFSAIGLVPDGGATWQLLHALGYKRAFEVIVEAKKIPAERCVEWGLANRIPEPGQLSVEARAWAEKLAQGAPLAQRYTKALLKEVMHCSLPEAIDREAKIQNICITSNDHQEGVIAFAEKRAPCFTGS